MPAQQFIESFRDEHRRLRDALLGLSEAFELGDQESIRDRIAAMAADAVPHFFVEREALYPALSEFYEPQYIHDILADQADAIDALRELAEMAEAEELDSEAAERGRELVRQLLPHVSDRDGLSMMVEVLPAEQVARMLQARDGSQRTLATMLGDGAKARKVPVIQRQPHPEKIKAKASARKPAKARMSHKKPPKPARRHAH